MQTIIIFILIAGLNQHWTGLFPSRLTARMRIPKLMCVRALDQQTAHVGVYGAAWTTTAPTMYSMILATIGVLYRTGVTKTALAAGTMKCLNGFVLFHL